MVAGCTIQPNKIEKVRDAMKVRPGKYTKIVRNFGDSPDPKPEVVFTGEVEAFLSAKSFFDSLVDVPEVHTRKPDGSIVVTQHTPWGTKRETVFQLTEAVR